MADRRLRIIFSNLPPRPRPLGDSETAHVFGGCSRNACASDKDCCLKTCYIFPMSNPKRGSCRQGVG
jgi:hypothetical protein